MIVREERKNVIQQIDQMLSRNCQNCEKRNGATERELRAKGMYAQADRYCLKECAIGQQLQELGKKLGRGHTGGMTRPRLQRRAAMLAE